MSSNMLVASLSLALCGSSSDQAGRSAAADDAVAKASADFQQSIYEFGLHLALGDPGGARRQMQETSRQLTVLRNRACPADLRKAASEVGRNLNAPEACAKVFDQIDRQLGALAERIDVSEARAHLAAAREALKKKELAKVQPECLELTDSVVGKLVDIPLVDWVEGFRKARRVLGDNPSRQRMDQAFEILRGMEGVARFRPKAYQDSLRLVDELIAAADDLYSDGAFRDAAEVLRRAEVPLQIAGRASRDEAIVETLARLWNQLGKADQLIVGDIDLARKERDEGFRLLADARSTIYELLKKKI